MQRRYRRVLCRVTSILIGIILLALVFFSAHQWLVDQRPGPRAAVLPQVASAADVRSTELGGAHRGAPNTTAKPTRVVKVCDLGIVTVHGDDGEDTNQLIQDYIDNLVEKKETHWIHQLADSGNLRIVAAGLLLEDHTPNSRLVTSANAEARNDLIQLAAGSFDPVLYGAAFNMCVTYGQAPFGADSKAACGRLSARQWAALDPSNGIPWLFVGSAAAIAGDKAGEAEAFARMSHANALQGGTDSLPLALLPLLPTEWSLLERTDVSQDLAIFFDSQWQPPYAALLGYCSQDKTGDDNAANECSAIGEMLAERGRTIMDLSVGLRLGERFGWPAERVAEVRKMRDSLLIDLPSATSDRWSCDHLRVLSTMVAEDAKGGQVAAMRAVVRLSGISAARISEKQVATVEQIIDFMDPGLKNSKATP